ncbi:hypothetical protein TrispH2_007439 [Trichoplax sp. H2]|nr:hypothetical protein TrispH2_007439 [Trichoplax sp. H2]|eukprot:RDD40352.1 hypothetical protein TrispH2_007439 [Trichoplax sp. H2]
MEHLLMKIVTYDTALSFSSSDGASFSGNSYLRYYINALKEQQDIQFTFATNQSSGLLYWQGNMVTSTTHYIYVTVNSGRVEL